MLDVGARLPTAGQHQHRLGQHLAAVMEWKPLTGDRDPRRQRITHPQAVGKRSKSMQPDMSDDLLATPSTTTGTVLLPFTSRVPSRIGVRTRRQRQNPLPGGHFRGWAALNPRGRVNDQG